MTASQKISWINNKVNELVNKIHELETKNRDLINEVNSSSNTIEKDLELATNMLNKKDQEIKDLKIELKNREDEIDDVVKKIDLLLK